MGWIVKHRAEYAKQHRCPCPSRKESAEGDVWRCDECGRLWKHKWGDYDRQWWWAGPWLRWKYRRR